MGFSQTIFPIPKKFTEVVGLLKIIRPNFILALFFVPIQVILTQTIDKIKKNIKVAFLKSAREIYSEKLPEFREIVSEFRNSVKF